MLQTISADEQFLVALVLWTLAGTFGLDVEIQPPNQIWCVDQVANSECDARSVSGPASLDPSSLSDVLADACTSTGDYV